MDMDKGFCECTQTQRLDSMSEKINTLTAIVRGNGDPSKGLVSKVNKLTEWMKQVRWAVGICVIAAISVITSSVKSYNATARASGFEAQLKQITVMLEKLDVRD